ncbi:hypothetical protein CRG98_025984 [Punica granatum]|uniref:Uncharacterized protein n=1 Tax=Punica granatum TaxID=22663 RepID=A0A2I0JD75_PUNGR|nr:hypothetical protein CRG98_025984 [Punica granatum]
MNKSKRERGRLSFGAVFVAPSCSVQPRERGEEEEACMLVRCWSGGEEEAKGKEMEMMKSDGAQGSRGWVVELRVERGVGRTVGEVAEAKWELLLVCLLPRERRWRVGEEEEGKGLLVLNLVLLEQKEQSWREAEGAEL